MKLTNAEKLILLMLSDIYEKLGLDGININLLRSAIYTENTWALDWEMPGVVGSDSEPLPTHVREVVAGVDCTPLPETPGFLVGRESRRQQDCGNKQARE